MSPEDWLSAEMQGEIVALVHSHPGGLPWLSEADRRLQVQSDLPWWLVCRGAIHKFRCVPHLTGRRFEHGVTDCYTLFRDAYHLAWGAGVQFNPTESVAVDVAYEGSGSGDWRTNSFIVGVGYKF